MKYTFAVGIAELRTVVVDADSEDEARDKAREVLDKRAENAGTEPPVAWDLRLKP